MVTECMKLCILGAVVCAVDVGLLLEICVEGVSDLRWGYMWLCWWCWSLAALASVVMVFVVAAAVLAVVGVVLVFGVDARSHSLRQFSLVISSPPLTNLGAVVRVPTSCPDSGRFSRPQ